MMKRSTRFGLLSGLGTWVGCFLLATLVTATDPAYPCTLSKAADLGLAFTLCLGSLLALLVGLFVAFSTPEVKGGEVEYDFF
jgi:hypothetical protein